jgi:elongation factor 1-gamma
LNKLVANEQLRGKTLVEQSQIIQWIEYGEREITPVSATLVYPSMGILQFNKQNNERAKDELKHILQLLNEYLHTRTFFVGERITLADITLACDLLLLFQWVQNLLLNFCFFNFDVFSVPRTKYT